MDKSPDAFRTISEVSEQLDTPAHVLRFWESRFPQIRPVKRAGGRRYYRPSDVALLAGIRKLLHDDGVTIRGVQKILREKGVRHVAGLGGIAPLPEQDADIEAVLAAEFGPRAEELPEAETGVQTAQVISLEAALARVEGREARAEAVRVPVSLGAEETIPEAPFIEAEEAPLPAPVPLRGGSVTAPDASVGGGMVAEDLPDEDSPPVGMPAAKVPAAVTQVAEVRDGVTQAASPADDRTDDSEQAVESLAQSTVMMRLRAADPAHARAQHEALIALRDRIFDLRARLAKGVRRRAR